MTTRTHSSSDLPRRGARATADLDDTQPRTERKCIDDRLQTRRKRRHEPHPTTAPSSPVDGNRTGHGGGAYTADVGLARCRSPNVRSGEATRRGRSTTVGPGSSYATLGHRARIWHVDRGLDRSRRSARCGLQQRRDVRRGARLRSRSRCGRRDRQTRLHNPMAVALARWQRSLPPCGRVRRSH